MATRWLFADQLGTHFTDDHLDDGGRLLLLGNHGENVSEPPEPVVESPVGSRRRPPPTSGNSSIKPSKKDCAMFSIAASRCWSSDSLFAVQRLPIGNSRACTTVDHVS
jgi:hypothetical protein